MHILSPLIRCDEGTAWCVLVLVGGVCNACQTAGQHAEIDRAHDERYSAVEAAVTNAARVRMIGAMLCAGAFDEQLQYMITGSKSACSDGRTCTRWKWSSQRGCIVKLTMDPELPAMLGQRAAASLHGRYSIDYQTPHSTSTLSVWGKYILKQPASV